tara:strand:- start:17043 stop:18080 length:1038 start_codon:yes stop_codon:yes gene_type:complete
MASTFKHFLSSDATSTRTLLHEAIPLTGSIVSGTYGHATIAAGGESNIKSFSHGMFQSVYDYPHLSSSANHIFDISVGVTGSSRAKLTTQASKKVNMYSQMAQMLVGHDVNGNIRAFDADGDLSAGTKHGDVVFLSLSRLLVKDEVKKGSFSMSIATGSAYHRAAMGAAVRTVADTGAATSYKTNSPAGEYGILYAQSTKVGLIYYQAGVVVLTGSVFGNGIIKPDSVAASAKFTGAVTGSTINDIATGVRNRIKNISFNNTTELNSTVYFCRANHNEFNYSSNPSYLTGSQIRVKNKAIDAPRSYITTVGMYSADNELLAVAKLSEPLRKDPTNEVTLRVRLDY